MNPGTEETVTAPPNIQIHVKGISLGAELEDIQGRSSLKLTHEFATSPADDDDDEEDEDEDEKAVPIVTKEVILGSLTPGKVSHLFPSLSNVVTPSFSTRLSKPPWTSSWMRRTNMFSK